MQQRRRLKTASEIFHQNLPKLTLLSKVAFRDSNVRGVIIREAQSVSITPMDKNLAAIRSTD